MTSHSHALTHLCIAHYVDFTCVCEYVCLCMCREKFRDHSIPLLSCFEFFFSRIVLFSPLLRNKNVTKNERQKSSTFHNYVMCLAIKISCIFGCLISFTCFLSVNYVSVRDSNQTKKRQQKTLRRKIENGKFNAA